MTNSENNIIYFFIGITVLLLIGFLITIYKDVTERKSFCEANSGEYISSAGFCYIDKEGRFEKFEIIRTKSGLKLVK